MLSLCTAVSVLQFKDSPRKLHGSMFKGFFETGRQADVHQYRLQLPDHARLSFSSSQDSNVFPSSYTCLQLLFLSSRSQLWMLTFFMMPLLTLLWGADKLLCDGPLHAVTSQHWNLAHCLFACFLSVKYIKERVQRQINRTHCEDQKQIRNVRKMCDLHVTIYSWRVHFIGKINVIKKKSQ